MFDLEGWHPSPSVLKKLENGRERMPKRVIKQRLLAIIHKMVVQKGLDPVLYGHKATEDLISSLCNIDPYTLRGEHMPFNSLNAPTIRYLSFWKQDDKKSGLIIINMWCVFYLDRIEFNESMNKIFK